MQIEKELISYLCIYGNTLESDLIEYIRKGSGKTVEEIEKLIDNLEMIGWVKKIAHTQLPSKPIYITKGGLELELALIAKSDALDLIDLDQVATDAKIILHTAEIKAEKKVKRKLDRLDVKKQKKSEVTPS